MKLPCLAWFGAISFALLRTAPGQDFVNLNFEAARFFVAPTPPGGWGDFVDPAMAFPGWTVYGVALYNNLTLGSPAVDLMGPSFPNAVGYTPLQGSYSVLMQYFGLAGGPPTLSQTAVVPTGTHSISFLVRAETGPADAAVTLNGASIPLVQISGGRLAGDITTFAGGVAQLTFSTPSSSGRYSELYLDDIRFSALSIPEPGSLSLAGLGILLCALRLVLRRICPVKD